MVERESIHPKEQGERSEAAVIADLVTRGVTVLQPFGDNKRYDLVVEEEGEFHRIQVKTGRMENGRIQFETRSSGTLTRRVKKEGYNGEIDMFAVYSPDLDQTYIVPIEEAPETTMGLRIANANKESPRINWAAEYQLSGWIEEIKGM